MVDETKTRRSTFGTAAYGGEGWSQRMQTHKQDLGGIWQSCGIDSEWRGLKSVLLHVPGQELMATKDAPDSVQMLAPMDVSTAIEEHDAMAQLYESLGANVHFVNPDTPCQPNQMFCADLFAMTPQGAILARPASTVRAGEERWVARRLACLGIPILKTITGTGTFEGADLMWIDETTAMIGRGHRTNQQAIEQIEQALAEIGIDLITVDMPYGTMHLMGMLRIADADLAVCWPRRTPYNAVRILEERGFHVAFPPFGDDQESYRGMNFVTVAPRRILMVQGLPEAQSFYEQLGIECLTTPIQELSKAAGNIGCLTGILEREQSIPGE